MGHKTTRRTNVNLLAKNTNREIGGNMDKLYNVSVDLEVLMFKKNGKKIISFYSAGVNCK